MKIGVIGNGALSNQLLNLFDQLSSKSIIYFDDYHENNGITKFPFLEWSDSRFSDLEFIVGLGYKNLQYKNSLIAKSLRLNRNLLSFTHHTSFINRYATIGKGVFIYPMCNIDQNVKIDDGVIINNSVTICHDSCVGKCTYISPSVSISGRVEIGENCFIGSGTIISNDIKVGSNVIIGIGTVVTSNVPSNCSVIGNPMKFLKRQLNLQ